MGKIIRAVAGDDFIKISVISAADIVERARQIHGLSPTTSAALGRTLCAVSMLGDMMKEEDAAVTVRIPSGSGKRVRCGRWRWRNICGAFCAPRWVELSTWRL